MNDLAKNLEADSAVYKTLLESTKAIPWKIDWSTGFIEKVDRLLYQAKQSGRNCIC